VNASCPEHYHLLRFITGGRLPTHLIACLSPKADPPQDQREAGAIPHVRVLELNNTLQQEPYCLFVSAHYHPTAPTLLTQVCLLLCGAIASRNCTLAFPQHSHPNLRVAEFKAQPCASMYT
jgi:hypothetical protein